MGRSTPPREIWPWAFAVLVVLSVVPVLAVDHLPLLDYPRHLRIAQALHLYDAPDRDDCLYLERDVRLRPYLGMYGLAAVLPAGIPVDAIGRVCLLSYVVLTPLFVLGYTHEISPGSGPAALLALPPLWSSLYYMGFVNFLMAVPWVFAGAWAAARLLRRPAVAPALALGVSAAVAWLCHVVAFGYLVLLVALLAALRRRWSVAIVTLAALAAAALAGAGAGISTGLPRVHYVPWGGAMPPQGAGRGFVYQSPIVTVLHVVASMATDAETLSAGLWGLPLGALAISAWRERGRSGRRVPERMAAALLAAVLLFALPHGTPDIDYVSLKMVGLLWLALPALVPAAWLDRRTVVTLGVFAAASLAVAASVHLRFDRECRGLDAIVARVPTGSTVLPVVIEPRSSALLWIAPFVHVGDLVQVARGGRGVEPFEGPQMPVRMRAEAVTGYARYLGKPWLVTAELPGAVPDLVLVRGEGPLLAFVDAGHDLLLREGAFSLYRPRAGGP